MLKNVASSTLALMGVLLIGLPLTACSANSKISEKDACKLATAFEVKDNDAEVNRQTGVYIKVKGCKNFMSRSDVGVAEIGLINTTMWKGKGGPDKEGNSYYRACQFVRSDQGWRVVRCDTTREP